MGYHIKDFKLDLRSCASAQNHIWVGSGYSTCAPVWETVTGVRECYSPPLAAPDTTLTFSFEADGHTVPDDGNKGKDDCGLLFSGACWLPDRIVRKGTYHYCVDGRLISFSAQSELVPLTGKAGFLMKIRLKNRSGGRLSVRILPRLEAGHPVFRPLEKWDYGKPRAADKKAERIAENVWENDGVRVSLLGDNNFSGILEKGETLDACFAVLLTRAGIPAPGVFEPVRWDRETAGSWERRIAYASERIPSLKSDIPGLEEYYKRSLISGLVCLWENDAYILKPFPVTSGMDGGAVCCYPWDDAGYSAEFLAMLLEEKAFELIRLMLHSGIDRHICMSVNGVGQGVCSYSYSMWSIVYFYWTVVTHTGKGRELFDEIVRLFENEEARLPEWENLKDYGVQHNLLEMRTRGYEHFAPSPNAERAWCYDRLADLAEKFGRREPAAWREKAENIRESIMRHLWDEKTGWFRCLFPDGSFETVYSIQVYDAVRMLPCDAAVSKAVSGHLKDGAFLGKYGVSSVSAEDEEHYELNDPDWSGGGCFSGDASVLALALWEKDEPELAWQILKRLFWMGEMLPYYPQEHYCDRPAEPANKRANDIAGVAGMEALLYGMAGVRRRLDGRLELSPAPVLEGAVEILGLRLGEKSINLLFRPGFMKVYDDQTVYYEGEVKPVVF